MVQLGHYHIGATLFSASGGLFGKRKANAAAKGSLGKMLPQPPMLVIFRNF